MPSADQVTGVRAIVKAMPFQSYVFLGTVIGMLLDYAAKAWPDHWLSSVLRLFRSRTNDGGGNYATWVQTLLKDAPPKVTLDRPSVLRRVVRPAVRVVVTLRRGLSCTALVKCIRVGCVLIVGMLPKTMTERRTFFRC
jgi:hypothetical protein